MSPETTEPSFGAIPSPVDDRDWTLASVGASVAYPDACFIDQDFLRVTNQGKIGSCVGNTFESIVRKIFYEKTGVQEELSWRFIYAVCKSLDGFAGEGTYPSLAAKVVRTYGVPLARYCPNTITLDHETFVYNRSLQNIPQEAFDDAKTRKAGADFTVPTTEEGIKQAVNYAKANNGGVAILRRIGDTYWRGVDGVSTYDKAKLLPMRPTDVIVSGHEEFLYGYDKEPQTGRMRIYWLNSWSPQWCSTKGTTADGGRGWEYFDVWQKHTVELRVTVAEAPFVNNFRYTFAKALGVGAKGSDVVALQHVLKLEGCFDYPTFTGYYGEITRAGVKKLQEKYADQILKPLGMTFGTGYFGSSTIKWVNGKYK